MGLQKNLLPLPAPASGERIDYLAGARRAFLAAAARGPTTIAEAVIKAQLMPPPGLDLRALGGVVLRAEKAGEVKRVERTNGVRPSSHGAPVIRWVAVARQ